MSISIDLSNIKSTKVLNIDGGRTATSIMNEYNPDFLLNLALYDTGSKLNITKMKSNGVTSGYLFSDVGICFDDGGIRQANFSENMSDFLAGSPTLVSDGEVNIDWGNKHSSYIDGVHKRSAVGISKDKMFLYTSPDSCSVGELAKRMKELGATTAINLDGGGSCHLQSQNQEITKSTRANVSWLAVYLKDNEEKEDTKMNFNLHAGHGIAGSASTGAKSIICESTENRNVVASMKKYLEMEGHKVNICTVDYPTSASDCINKIVTACNKNAVDLDISIHFNAGVGDTVGNGVTTGVEVYTYSATSKANPYADRVCKKVSELGFRNRGVKYSTSFGVLRSTKSPAMLVECCFVDDRDDCNLYNVDKMAKAIVEGILNKSIDAPTQDVPVVKEEQTSGSTEGTRTITVDGKEYQMIATMIDRTTYVKLLEFTKAGYKVGSMDGIAYINKP